jgi:polygalacturonase
MSGGVKNINVTNCTFIGTDIGLRFKTTRGRGGLVENIFIKDIYMKDIVGEAILFDMYYTAKDPVPMAGEQRELPKVEMKPVDETTPQFKNFTISNVYCSGAEKGIFIRGLPEKHVEQIAFNNINIYAKKGIDIQEASSINFKNVTVVSEETNPMVDILNSNNIAFDNLHYNEQGENLFRVSGDRNAAIIVVNTDVSKTKEKLKLEFGATESVIQIK